MIGAQRPRVDVGARRGFRPRSPCRDEGHAEAVVDHLHQRVQRGAHHRRMRAKLGPVAGRQRMILEAMPVLEQQQPVLVDRPAVDRPAPRGASPRGKATNKRIVEQRRAVDLAAGEGEREQHAIELAAMKRLARRVAGLLAQVELQLGPLLAQPRKHRRQQERGDGRDDAHAQLAVKRLGPRRGPFRPAPRSRAGRGSPCPRSSRPSAVKRTTRRVRSTRVTPSRVSSSRKPGRQVDWVTKQASAALPKWPVLRAARPDIAAV